MSVDTTCCPAAPNCAVPCYAGQAAGGGGTGDACEIAQLIFESQSSCYVMQRRSALRKLGYYNCMCHPEIVAAFVYSMNDCDARVRMKAVDELGDQLRRHHCCCSPGVVCALTQALGDCNFYVRIEAEQALRLCGYDIVNPGSTACTGFACSATCCNTTCAPAAIPPAPVDHAVAPIEPGVAPAPLDVPGLDDAPTPDSDAPAPAAQRESTPGLFPTTESRPLSAHRSLSNLFGMLK